MRSIKKNKRSRLNRKTRLYKFKSIKKRNSKLKRKRLVLKTRRKQRAGTGDAATGTTSSLEEEDRTNKVFKDEITKIRQAFDEYFKGKMFDCHESECSKSQIVSWINQYIEKNKGVSYPTKESELISGIPSDEFRYQKGDNKGKIMTDLPIEKYKKLLDDIGFHDIQFLRDIAYDHPPVKETPKKYQILIDLNTACREIVDDAEEMYGETINYEDVLKEIIDIIFRDIDPQMNRKSYENVFKIFLFYFGDNKKAYKFIYRYKSLYKALYMFLTKQDDIDNDKTLGKTINETISEVVDFWGNLCIKERVLKSGTKVNRMTFEGKFNISDEGDADKAREILKQNGCELIKQALGGSGTDSVPNIPENNLGSKLSELEGLLINIGKNAFSKDPYDFQNDSSHDNLITKSYSKEDENTLKAKCSTGTLVKDNIETYGTFFLINDDGLPTDDVYPNPCGESFNDISFIVDAGSFKQFKSYNEDHCDPNSKTTKNVSNYVDPAQTGTGDLFRCYNYLTEVSSAPPTEMALTGANQFLKLCIAFTKSIILESGQKLNTGEKPETYNDVFTYLEGIEITKIVKSNLNCTHKNHGGNFNWEGNQAPMAHCINKANVLGVNASPRSRNTKSDLIDNFQEKYTKPEHTIALCRVLKYMGDKSHIVAAIILLYLEKSPYIVQTIDRLLSKSIIQVIEYCRTKKVNKDYELISKYLGVMISGGELNKPPKYSQSLSLYENLKNNDKIDFVSNPYNVLFMYFIGDIVKAKLNSINRIINSFIEFSQIIEDKDIDDIYKITKRLRIGVKDQVIIDEISTHSGGAGSDDLDEYKRKLSSKDLNKEKHSRLQKIAKKLGIKIFQKKKIELIEEIGIILRRETAEVEEPEVEVEEPEVEEPEDEDEEDEEPEVEGEIVSDPETSITIESLGTKEYDLSDLVKEGSNLYKDIESKKSEFAEDKQEAFLEGVITVLKDTNIFKFINLYNKVKLIKQNKENFNKLYKKQINYKQPEEEERPHYFLKNKDEHAREGRRPTVKQRVEIAAKEYEWFEVIGDKGFFHPWWGINSEKKFSDYYEMLVLAFEPPKYASGKKLEKIKEHCKVFVDFVDDLQDKLQDLIDGKNGGKIIYDGDLLYGVLKLAIGYGDPNDELDNHSFINSKSYTTSLKTKHSNEALKYIEILTKIYTISKNIAEA